MTELNYKFMFEELKRVHDSTNEAVRELHKQLTAKDAEIQRLMTQLLEAQNNLMAQKTVVSNYIADAEEYKNSLEQELVELKNKSED